MVVCLMQYANVRSTQYVLRYEKGDVDMKRNIIWLFCAIALLGCEAEENAELSDGGSNLQLLTPDCVRYVDPEVAAGGDALSWETAAVSVEDALVGLDEDEADACEVWVKGEADGESVATSGSATVYSGFNGTEKARMGSHKPVSFNDESELLLNEMGSNTYSGAGAYELESSILSTGFDNGDKLALADDNTFTPYSQTINDSLVVNGYVNIQRSSSPALYVSGKEALWSNGNYFSWGYGANWNRFTDPIGIGLFGTNDSPMGDLDIRDNGDASIYLYADRDNSNESDNAFMILSQDGNLVRSYVGLEGTYGHTVSGSHSNSLLLGSITDHPVQLFQNNMVVMTIDASGRVGIGDRTPAHKLSVSGTIQAREIIVENFTADFVFDDDYPLMSLEETEAYIDENGHLPNIANADSVENHGANIGETQTRLLQKIEELTLHLIEQNKRLKAQETEMEAMRHELTATRISYLK